MGRNQTTDHTSSTGASFIISILFHIAENVGKADTMVVYLR